jgi:GNAT superfamily N-acetyltransferase
MHIPEVTIRGADFDAACQMYWQIPEFVADTNYDITEQWRLKNIANLNPFFIIGELDGRAGSFAIAYDKPAGHDEKEAASLHIWLAGTDPDFRSRGLLRAMVDAVCVEAILRGRTRVTAKSHEKRFPVMVRRLGELGFVKYGPQEGPEVRLEKFV